MSTARLHCRELSPGLIELSPEESHHAAHVVRAHPGDSVTLFDGRGTEASGVVARCDGRTVTVEVESVRRRPFELRHRVTLAVAMSRRHRQGYLIEKCTELGAAAIQPIIAARSVTQPGGYAVEKWLRRAVEAAKQSGRAWVPSILPPESFADVLARADSFHASYLTDVDRDAPPLISALMAQAPDTEALVFVGPEGGWTDEERASAADTGAVVVSLSPTVLRTETAAVAVCAAAAAVTSLRPSA